MSLTETFATATRLALLLAGLLGPGSLLLRACRLPWSLAGSFVSSCALIYVSVLVFTFAHVPISLVTLAAGLALFSAAWVVVIFRRGGTTEPAAVPPWSFLTSLREWAPLYLAFWFIVIYRLGTDPLSGPDVHFRWSYLAEQMLRFGSLNFYPPQTTGDFVRYFWPESIPPGVAGVYAWAYGCAGNARAVWTAPVVALQLLSLHDIVWRLAHRHGGANAGRVAVLLVAACPLLTWSFLIGQETGLLAIAVAGLAWCLDRPERSAGSSWAVLGGVFAIAAGSTREYGLAYVVAAVVVAACLPATRRKSLILAAVALPVALAWPLRVWALTGNPFYSLDLGSMFPVNAAFVSWNDAFRAAQHSALGSAASWLALTRYLVLWALPAVLGLGALLALLVRRAESVWLTVGFVAPVTFLWLTSVAYTAGGLFYSLRVLAPAYALLAVPAARLASSRSLSPSMARWLGVGLFMMSLEALPKTLVLPDNPYRVPILQWGEASRRITDSFHGDEPEVAAKLAALPGRRRVISDGFDLPATATKLGFEVDPPWSPEVNWLSNQAMDPIDAARQWRASRLRFLIVGKTGPMADYLQSHGRWRTPYYQIESVDQTSGHIIFEIIPTGIPVP